MRNIYLIRLSGDVTYRKKGSRMLFEKLLVRNVSEALKINNYKFKIKWEPARIFIEGENIDIKILKRIFGISSISLTKAIDFSNLKDLANKIKEIYKDKLKDKTFAIRCRRSGKHEFTSLEVSKIIGSCLKPFSKGVNLENPDLEIMIEIRNKVAYVYEETVKGSLGLPLGSGDKILSLFSGGFDSPIAAWYVAKRGCTVDFIHFSFGSLNEVYEALKVAKYLSENWFYGYTPKFYVVRFSGIIKEIMLKLNPRIWQVALRRAMYLASEKLAMKLSIDSLVTGESISQATSQTIRNLRAAEYGIKLPIIRPLIGLDKEEIIKLSREIGVYDLSVKVEELCAIAIGPLTPRVNVNKFLEEFNKINLSLIDKSLNEYIEINLKEDEEKIKKILKEEEFTINYIPHNSIVINLMPEKFKIPNSISLLEFDEKLYKNSLIIFVCEKGLTSKGLAKYYREDGFRAYSLDKGFETLKKILNKKKND